MAFRVTLTLTDGGTVVYDNVEDYDIDDQQEDPEEVDENPMDNPDETEEAEAEAE